VTTKREQRKRDKDWVERHVAQLDAERREQMRAQLEHEAELNARARTEERVLREQGKWNDKPWAQQVADARYVLRWCPWYADTLSRSLFSMPDLLASAKEFEILFTKIAGEIGIGTDDVVMLMQVPDEADRKDALAVLIIDREIAAGRMEPPAGWLEAHDE
jgi:hypothetical protein